MSPIKDRIIAVMRSEPYRIWRIADFTWRLKAERIDVKNALYDSPEVFVPKYKDDIHSGHFRLHPDYHR